jgi:hypothetical protein
VYVGVHCGHLHTSTGTVATTNCLLLQGDGKQQSWQPVYRTEVVPNNLNPTWRPITLRATTLNNGDMLRPLLLKVTCSCVGIREDVWAVTKGRAQLDKHCLHLVQERLCTSLQWR